MAPHIKNLPGTIETIHKTPFLPPEVEDTINNYWTCEFTTIGKSGTPISWPVYPVYLPSRQQFLVLTALGYPQKARNVRRNSHVSMFFSNPTGSGLENSAQVLVQGIGSCPEEIFTGSSQVTDAEIVQEFKKQVLRLMRVQPAVDLYLKNSITQKTMDWYFMRLMIYITPKRILWWPHGDLSKKPMEKTFDVG